MRRLLAFALLLIAAPPAGAQLASPGPLTRAHAQLEGLRSCIRCHELRQAGISPALCLSCHTPLARRLRARRGYHGRLSEKDCASCHQEHIGAAADIVRLDTASFQHERTGFPLRGAHATAGCRQCHSAERVVAADVRAYASSDGFLSETYLGLATSCAGCHQSESSHEPTINRLPCERCHDERDWKTVDRFDHDESAYPLTGAHRTVLCARCHERSGKLQLTGIAHAGCADCHHDPHAGRFGAGCAGCHQTASWQRVPAAQVAARFDHARTRFPLRGVHARAACAACHDRSTAHRDGIRLTFPAGSQAATFPPPVSANCGSCHTDFHHGQVRRGGEACERCHSEEAWLPVHFDAAAHERTRFALAGAHLAVPCSECHVRASPELPPQLQWQDLDCRACHATDDPHRGIFGTQACGSCHTNGGFKGAVFDHGPVRDRQCVACHQADDPHLDQFAGRDCGACHVTGSFRIEQFEHGRTRFPLEGAHARVVCAACHPRQADGTVRYRPLPLTCAGCHGALP
jgi:hypothetical protein